MRPRPSLRSASLALLSGIAAAAAASAASAADPTPGYPEPVVQWVVQKGETCAAIATSLYGSPKHTGLLNRYSRVDCAAAELPEGLTLVVPTSVTSLPDAKLRSLVPAVQSRAAGGGWSPAAPGAALFRGHSINTLEKARADIEFTDRTRVFLAENTLVVIYGTAARTAVSKTAPQSIELEKGEVKAGLAALRGEPVEIAVKGGGTIRAASKDAVVQRQGERTTVAVYDGTAEVRNGGKKIDVPTNFGTRFVGAAPPTPPRPLPPAPPWSPGGFGDVVLAPVEGATLSASWQAIPKAKSYRFEIARDPEFRDLLAREEVPASVLSFRAEKIPAGTYHVAVRAIDDEEYLGVASVKRVVAVVHAAVRLGAATLGTTGIDVTRYTVIAFDQAPASVKVAFDQGALGPIPSAIDFGKVTPSTLRFRLESGGEIVVPVRYRKVEASVSGSIDGASGRIDVTAAVTGLEGIDLAELVKPVFRVHLAKGALSIPATVFAGGLTATLGSDPGTRRARVDLVDGGGALLGTGELLGEGELLVAPGVPPPVVPAIGVTAPLLTVSTLTNVAWWSPTARGAATLSAAFDREGGKNAVSGVARASGGIGFVGFDASLASRSSAFPRTGDESAWLGVRVRTARRGLAELEHGIALRVSLPTTPQAAAPRLEPAMALGGVSDRLSWLANLGARVRLEDSLVRVPTSPFTGFALLGGTWAFDPSVRGYAVLDAHVITQEGTSAHVRGGATAGAEVGRAIFGGLGLRASPWDDAGAPVTLQLALGFREW